MEKDQIIITQREDGSIAHVFSRANQEPFALIEALSKALVMVKEHIDLQRFKDSHPPKYDKDGINQSYGSGHSINADGYCNMGCC